MHGQQLYIAAEEAGSTMMRIFLRAFRPFIIRIFADGTDAISLIITRPFRWYFHRVEVENGQGELLGVVERQFALLSRTYFVSCAGGRENYSIESPLLSPWTFYIRDSNGEEQGKITKKWGGFIKETISNADDFGVTWPAQWDSTVKSVLLGAVFLIDFIYFESRGQR